MSIKNQIKFLISIVMILGWFVSAQAQDANEPDKSVAPVPKNSVVVGVAPYGGYVILGGSVIPLKKVTLSAQIPGRIINIAGEEGDAFKAGDKLIKINDDDLQAKKDAALAQLVSAQNAMQNAEVQYNRELWTPRVDNPRPMAGMGMPAMFDGFFNSVGDNGSFGSGGNKSIERRADLSNQSTQVASARSHITAAESALRTINSKLRDSEAIAPFDGIIIKKMVEIGDTVQPGQPLVVFSYSKFLRIQVDVPARLMTGLKKGMIVPVKLDVDNKQFNARVAQIAPVADNKQHTIRVKFDLPEGTAGSVGMYAEVMIPDTRSPTRALPLIPQSAISKRGSLPSVQVLDENNIPRMRLIRTGIEIGDDRVVVLSGLKAGERILTSKNADTSSGVDASKKWKK